ncbi:MAG TPA: BON domain-containing protein [Candidatus Acidoferrales bacterium]|jgi:osmotically-inducible protein OsmY|nr:BON domain-containing protein [Candidatus Acidoferrales bacterium]
MNACFRKSRSILPFGILAFSLSLAAAPIIAAAPATAYHAAARAQADNATENKDQSSPNADQQKMNPADRSITQNIRKAIYKDRTLSTYAHNIKIITQDGKVTLRGPVRSEDEKSNIEAKAVSVAGAGNVTDDLEVAPAK